MSPKMLTIRENFICSTSVMAIKAIPKNSPDEIGYISQTPLINIPVLFDNVSIREYRICMCKVSLAMKSTKDFHKPSEPFSVHCF